MGKASREKKTGRKETSVEIVSRSAPNWLLLGFALIGMALAAYLTVAYWRGQALAGCPAGSGCDVVLSSRWSKLFGLPISLWGFFAYAALAGIAFIKRADIHWRLAWTVALFGVAYSLYLTVVSLTELKAACPYCLSSSALMIAILGTVAYQRPGNLPGFSWRPWLLSTGAGALAVVIVLHLYYAGMWGAVSTVEDPKVRALAEHLAKTDAKFYGASWCPHCAEQKELFGESARRLPYLECSPQGPSVPQATVCQAAGVNVYPTWIIDGRRYEGVLTPEELARYSKFEGGFP